MKKRNLLLLCVLPLLSGCNLVYHYTPSHPYPGADDENVGPLGEYDMTVYFYLDFSHSDEPIYEMRWYMLHPIGECPAEAMLDDSKAADPLFPNFIGYSEYSSAMDEDLIWKFDTDYKQSNILNLYGIWVKK